jgi:hypothetical protein
MTFGGHSSAFGRDGVFRHGKLFVQEMERFEREPEKAKPGDSSMKAGGSAGTNRSLRTIRRLDLWAWMRSYPTEERGSRLR